MKNRQCKHCQAELAQPVGRGRPRIYCSKECRAEDTKDCHNKRALQYYYDNKEAQLINRRAYQDGFRATYVNPEAKRVIAEFNALSEEERPSYVRRLLEEADRSYKVARVVNHYAVDELIGGYAGV